LRLKDANGIKTASGSQFAAIRPYAGPGEPAGMAAMKSRRQGRVNRGHIQVARPEAQPVRVRPNRMFHLSGHFDPQFPLRGMSGI
jgi:hypothetical protein